MGCILFFIVFSHGFHRDNGFGAHGFGLEHGLVLYLRKRFTYKRKTPLFKIIRD
jgi:hypothetical protein